MDKLTLLLTWLAGHADALIAIAVILGGAIQTMRATHSFRQGLAALMLRAEKAQASGTLPGGPELMNLVVQVAQARLVPMLPLWLRPLFNADRVRAIAQAVYDASRELIVGTAIPTPNNP